jgi:hypothetical protein
MLRFKRCFSFYTKLGRWKIDHDLKIINIKIDQANKDNSDTYNFEKDFVKKNPPVKDENNELKELKDDFLLPYCM